MNLWGLLYNKYFMESTAWWRQVSLLWIIFMWQVTTDVHMNRVNILNVVFYGCAEWVWSEFGRYTFTLFYVNCRKETPCLDYYEWNVEQDAHPLFKDSKLKDLLPYFLYLQCNGFPFLKVDYSLFSWPSNNVWPCQLRVINEWNHWFPAVNRLNLNIPVTVNIMWVQQYCGWHIFLLISF